MRTRSVLGVIDHDAIAKASVELDGGVRGGETPDERLPAAPIPDCERDDHDPIILKRLTARGLFAVAREPIEHMQPVLLGEPAAEREHSKRMQGRATVAEVHHLAEPLT